MKSLHLKLIPGREYLFTHKRKRTFRGVFKRIVRAPSTDALDEFYLECEVDSSLSGKAWFRTDEKTLIHLRPSLITVIQNAPKIETHERMRISHNDGVKPPEVRDDSTGGYFLRIRLVLGDIRRKWSK